MPLLERGLGIVERVDNAIVRRRQPVRHAVDGPTPLGLAQDDLGADAPNDGLVIDDSVVVIVPNLRPAFFGGLYVGPAEEQGHGRGPCRSFPTALSAWYFFLSLSNAVEHFEQCPLLTLRGEGRWAALLIVVVLVEIFLGGFLCHLNKAFFGASAHCGYGVERDRH